MLRVTQLIGFGVGSSDIVPGKVLARSGSYAVVGNTAGVRKTSPASKILTAAAASYSLTGAAAVVTKSSSTSAEATAFLARTSGLDATHINAYTALIDGLVADGIWAKLDVLHVYATQDSTTALLNLISSSHTGTANGSPTFTADRGFTGVDGSTTVYININYNPNTHGTTFTQNAAHISAWPINNITSGYIATGVLHSVVSNETVIYPRYTDGKTYYRANGAGATGFTNSNSIGHYIASRTSSSNVDGYKNGSLVGSTSGAAAIKANLNVYSIANDSNGGPVGSAYQLAMVSYGGDLSSANATAYYNRLRTYMTAVGVP